MQNDSAMCLENAKDVLKNGLTVDQVSAAKKLIAQAGPLRTICDQSGFPYATVQNVLRGTSPNIPLLSRVLDECKKKIEEKNQWLKSIPAA